MPKLSELRDEQLVGEVAFRIGDGSSRPLLFHGYANAAFYLTLDALRNLERIAPVGPGPYVIPAIAFWFLSVESYVSLLYKVVQEVDRHMAPPPAGVSLRATSQVVEKARAFEEYLTGQVSSPNPFAALQEFASVRNDLLHDLTTEAPRREYHHTLFSARAEKVNQTDAVEAMRVSIELFAYFRNAFRGADLMPSIQVGAAFEKLDQLAVEVVMPSYEEILEARGFDAPTGEAAAATPALFETVLPVSLLTSHAGPVAPVDPVAEPGRVDRRLDAAAAVRQPEPDLFMVPDYARGN